jgi:hypothetical protein
MTPWIRVYDYAGNVIETHEHAISERMISSRIGRPFLGNVSKLDGIIPYKSR